MRKLIAFILTILVIISSTSALTDIESSGAGIKFTVTEELVDSLKSKFMPEILSRLNNITVPDQEFAVDLKITKLKLALKNILFSLNTTAISEENFQVTFTDPNKINLDITGIQGSISFEDSMALAFLKEQSKVKANLISFGIKLELNLDQIESKTDKGKMLPLITLENIAVNLDFDYNLEGDWLVKIANTKLIKGLVIRLVKSQVNSMLSGSLKKTINKSISSTIANLPTNLIIDGNSLALDYEIVSPPKIQSGKYFTLNSKGLLFNIQLPETQNPPFNLTKVVPDFNDSDKILELLLSEFTVNSALYTLWKSGLLQAKVDDSILPPEFPVKLNTTALDILFNGVSAKYGIDIPVELNCGALENPLVKFSQDNLDLSLDLECKIYVFTIEGKKEQAYWFKSTLGVSIRLSLNENGNANVNVNYAVIDNSKMIQTTVEETNIENIENWLNFASNLGLSYVNKNFLNNLKIGIPIIKGINFNNSTVVIKDNYIDLHVTPEIQQIKFLN